MAEKNGQMNRREFIGTTAVGAAAVALPSAGAEAAAERSDARPKGMPRPTFKTSDLRFQCTPFRGKVVCGERPMAGLIVSNGRDSVKTAADGTYVLPEFPEARFITLTVPSGYQTEWWSLDAWQRRGRFDFSLTKCPETEAGNGCRFLHISDSEIKSGRGQRWVEDVRRLAERERCAFIVHTGDICGRNGLIAHQRIMNEETMGCKVVYTVGNHDLVSTFPWGEAEYEALYGPAWYSFDACGVHFLVTPMKRGDRPPSYDEDQIADWIRGDLALVDPAMPVIVFNHYVCNADNPEKCAMVYGEACPVDLRKVCNYRGYVYGHTHNSWLYRKDGVTVVNTSNPNMGGIDHSPNCARVVTVAVDGAVSSKTFYGCYGESPAQSAVPAVWETQLPAGVMYGGLLEGGDTLFCATSDDDGAGAGCVAALAKADGRQIWRAPVLNTIKGRLACAAGNVIGVDVEGRVYAFRETDGREMWRADLSAGVNDRLPMLAAGAAASPDGRQVTVGVGTRLAVLDAATGVVIWKDGHYPEREPLAVAPVFVDGRIVTVANWGGLWCNDAATGRLLWSHPCFAMAGAAPVVSEGVVVWLESGTARTLDLASGRVIRTVKAPKEVGFAVTGDILAAGPLYIKGSPRHGVVALDRQSLRVVWKGTCGASLAAIGAYRGVGARCVPTTPALAGKDVVCAAAADGAIHFWRLADGRHLKAIATGTFYLGGVVVSGGRLFAADMAGVVRAFDCSELVKT